MKVSEFKRWLKSQDCTIDQGARHVLVMRRGMAAPLPRHDGQEIKTGTMYAILKQLGPKEIWDKERR